MKTSFRRVLIAAFLLFLLSVVALVILYPKLRTRYIGVQIDKNRYPITGIDISNHVGNVDFVKVREKQIDFVIAKATEGENFIDQSFESYYVGAKKNDIPFGAYHFFRFNKSGKSQAENFMQIIKHKNIDLPLVLDVEDWGNPIGVHKDSIINHIREFIETIETATGRGVMIYTNENGYAEYIEGNFDEQPLWICSFRKQPSMDDSWLFWQHSHRGKYGFSDGLVDINTFNGDRKSWEEFLRNSKSQIDSIQ